MNTLKNCKIENTRKVLYKIEVTELRNTLIKSKNTQV